MSANATEGVARLGQRPAEAARGDESLRSLIESISSELSLEPLLTRIVESAVALLGAAHGAIGLVVETDAGPVVRTAAVCNLSRRVDAEETATGAGLAARVLQEGRPVRLDRYADLGSTLRPDIAEHAMIGIPIWWGGRINGFFGVGAPPPRRFDDADVDTLSLFARHAAVAIENARLFEAERRRTARMDAINRIGRLLTRNLRLDVLLQTAINVLAEHLQYQTIAVMLLDPDDPETLVLRARGGVYAESDLEDYRQSIHVGIAGEAARTRRRLLVNDVRNDPRYIPVSAGESLRAELALPLVAGERLLGLLNIESEHPFTDEDAADFEIVADQLAVAIENARLFEAEQRRAVRIATINRIGRLLTATLSLDETLQTAVEAIHQQLGFASVAVLLVEPDAPEHLAIRARAGLYGRGPLSGYRQSVGEGLIGAAARSRQPVLVNDVTRDPRYIPIRGSSGIRAELAVPVVAGERLLGVLNAESMRPISEEDADGLAIVADQLAVAIENARLFARTEAALEETRLLYDTSRRMSAAPEIRDVVVAYLEQVAAGGRYACSVALYETNDAGERTAVLALGRWTPEDGMTTEEQRFPRTNDGLDPPLDAGQTVTIADVYTDPRVSEELRRIQTVDQRPALAMIPLMVRDERIGLIVLADRIVRPWCDADLHPYQITAVQLSAAIESRRQQRLLAERGRQLAVFEERQRLARELHDSVTQLVFSVTLMAQTLASAWRRDPAEGERRVGRLIETSQSALAELRALLGELRPAARGPAPLVEAARAAGGELVRREGLAAALTRLAAEMSGDGPRVELETAGYASQASAHEQALYRITQEALHNVRKHARAGRVAIRLRLGEGELRLTIADDGAGFTPGTASPSERGRSPASGGIGLNSMRERAEELGGRLQISSQPARGTTVEVVLPRKDEE